MRKNLVIRYAFFWFLQSFCSMAQSEVAYGFSVNHGISLLSNKQKVVSDQIGAAFPNTSSGRHPKGLWRVGSIAIDTYWSDKRLVASIGLNSFHYKYDSDSVLPSYPNAQSYGIKTRSRSIVLPFIRLGYRFSLSEHLMYQPSFSFGMTQVFERFKSKGIAYDPAGQDSWNDENQWYIGLTWGFEFEKKAFMFELGNHLVYDLNRWSFSGGLSYYFYRNLPIEGYQGLHLNVGCSVRLGAY